MAIAQPQQETVTEPERPDKLGAGESGGGALT